MIRRSATFVLSTAALVTLAAVAHAKLARTGDAKVEFEAKGPAGMKITGTTNALTVSETDSEIVLTVPLNTVKTGIALRDTHMTEKYLETGKYPNAELRVAKDAVKGPSGQVSGQVTIHGKTKPTNVKYTQKPDGNISGSFHVEMTDFGIEKPGYSGISVQPGVEVTASFRVSGN
jgi:polyisoprenoid-binding protein YceI